MVQWDYDFTEEQGQANDFTSIICKNSALLYLLSKLNKINNLAKRSIPVSCSYQTEIVDIQPEPTWYKYFYVLIVFQ